MNCNDINSGDIISILAEFDMKPVYSNGNEHMYHAHYRSDSEPSLNVNSEKNVWIDHGTGCGGRTVDLLMKLYRTESVSEMLSKFNNQFRLINFQSIDSKSHQSKNKLLSKSIGSIRSPQLKSYLSSRGISSATWHPYLEEIKFISKDKSFTGIGFKNDADGYEIRTVPNGKFCIGNKAITTIPKSPIEVAVFEGFMDMLSWIELGLCKDHSIIVLNSTVNDSKGIEQAMNLSKEANLEVYFDNDSSGKSALESFKKSGLSVIDKSGIYEKHNDLNDYLQAQRKLQQQNKGMRR